MVEFKKFKIGSSYVIRGHEIKNDINGLFEILPTKKRINSRDAKVAGPYNYVSRGTTNNGIAAHIDYDPKFLNEGNTLSFAQDTAAVFYQDQPYFTGNKVNVLRLNSKYGALKRSVALYLQAAINSAFPDFTWGTLLNIEKIANTDILLPVTSTGDPDFAYMARRIDELEAQRIDELEAQRIDELSAYLKVSGLDNTVLTDEEKDALTKKVAWKKFRIGDLFERASLPRVKKDFVKRNDLSKVQTEEFNLPLVNSKVGNNGIMYYGRQADWKFTELGIDIIQDGAVGAGMVYAQPDETGCLYNAYIIRWKDPINLLNKKHILYFATVIRKALYGTYNYQRKATWDRVQNDDIVLPVKLDGTIDFDYMQHYITAIEKQSIKGVIAYKDKVIATTKKVVNGNV